MDLVDESIPAPRLMSEIIASLRVNEKEMATLCQDRFIAAPDLLERIVQDWGVPFRKAKVAVEKAVRYSEAEGVEHVSISALRRAAKEEGLNVRIDAKLVQAAQEPRDIVSRRKAIGGTSPRALQKNILAVFSQLQSIHRWLTKKRNQQSVAKTRLTEMERNL
jgi:argininosuccinate lyase